MTKKKLRTFTDITMKSCRQGLANEAILMAERNLFGQMILIVEIRKLQMISRLIPWGLCHGHMPAVMGLSARSTRLP
jgi:hypothetical protein